MIELLIALFGGMYLCARFASDKSASKAFDRSVEKRDAWHTERQKQWESQVYDRALEEDLRNFIVEALSSKEIREKVWEEVNEAYMQMPSRRDEIYASSPDMMNLSNFHIFGYTGPIAYEDLSKKRRQEAVSDWIDETLDIMLARRGRIRSHPGKYCYCLTSLGPGEGKYSKSEWDKKFDFCVYIRDELRRHGVAARPVFNTGYAGSDDHGIAYDIDDVDKFRYKYGTIQWLPLTYFDDNLHYV